ncbi:MAG: C-terminal binding protein [Candidatus Atribacteria bacterium]
MRRFKVVVSDRDYTDLSIEESILESIDAEVVDAQCKSGGEALLKYIIDADAVLQQYAEIRQDVIEKLHKCKIIARYGTGVDILDVETCHKRGIIVTNVPYYCVDEVADHAIVLALTLARRIPMYVDSVRCGKWHWSNSGAPIHRFEMQIFGIIGFGKIGRNIARKAKALKFTVMAYDPNVNNFFMKEEGVKKVDLGTILDNSDILCVQVPLSSDTHHLIGELELKRMKKSTILINTARGPLVDNKALYKALSEGRITAAGLDDIEDEPAKREYWNYQANPLLKLKNCLITPHSAYYSEESIMEARRTATEEVKAVLLGKKPRYAV